jgi:hypothetical protein
VLVIHDITERKVSEKWNTKTKWRTGT